MRGYRLHAEPHLEAIDACLFSGDTFESPEALAELKEYLDRWQRRITELRELVG